MLLPSRGRGLPLTLLLGHIYQINILYVMTSFLRQVFFFHAFIFIIIIIFCNPFPIFIFKSSVPLGF